MPAEISIRPSYLIRMRSFPGGLALVWWIATLIGSSGAPVKGSEHQAGRRLKSWPEPDPGEKAESDGTGELLICLGGILWMCPLYRVCGLDTLPRWGFRPLPLQWLRNSWRGRKDDAGTPIPSSAPPTTNDTTLQEDILRPLPPLMEGLRGLRRPLSSSPSLTLTHRTLSHPASGSVLYRVRGA